MSRDRTPGLLAAVMAVLVLAASTAVALPPPHVDGFVPVVGKLAGKGGSFWTSDLWIYSAGATRVQLWLNRGTGDQSGAQGQTVELDAGVTEIRDVVATVFGTTGKGSLHYSADGPVTVVSRISTPGDDGGIYGQTIPGVRVNGSSAAAGGGMLVTLPEASASMRANLGLLNVTDDPVDVVVEVVSASGAALRTLEEITLGPFGYVQRDAVLDGISTADPAAVRAIVTGGSGAIVGYLSEVDGTTNDGFYQQAFPTAAAP